MIGATAVSRDGAAPYWGTLVLRAKGRLRLPWHLLELAAQRPPAPGYIGMQTAGGQTYWLTYAEWRDGAIRQKIYQRALRLEARMRLHTPMR